MRKEKVKPPWILSADVHFTQGVVEIENVSWDEGRNALEGDFIGEKHGTSSYPSPSPHLYSVTGFVCDNGRLDNGGGLLKLNLIGCNGSHRKFELDFAEWTISHKGAYIHE